MRLRLRQSQHLCHGTRRIFKFFHCQSHLISYSYSVGGQIFHGILSGTTSVPRLSIQKPKITRCTKNILQFISIILLYSVLTASRWPCHRCQSQARIPPPGPVPWKIARGHAARPLRVRAPIPFPSKMPWTITYAMRVKLSGKKNSKNNAMAKIKYPVYFNHLYCPWYECRHRRHSGCRLRGKLG